MARQKQEAILSQEAAVADLLSRLAKHRGFLDRSQAQQALTILSETLSTDLRNLSLINSKRQQMMQDAAAATSYTALHTVHQQLNAFEQERFFETPSVPALHRSATEYRDLLARRTLVLVEKEMEKIGRGAAPLAYSLICMGSDGREEQTLVTDQDYLIVYSDSDDESADDYFRSFSELLVERLAEVGFKKCTGDIMPSNPTWRGSLSAWQKRLWAIIRFEYEEYSKNLMDLIVLSDVRYVAGDQKLADCLMEMVHQFEANYFHVIWGMAKAATEMKLALGFWNRLWADRAGEHKGKINLKLLAWAPLVMNVRLLAVHQGITETNTLRRIAALGQAGNFSPGTVADLTLAYHLFTRHRIQLQISAVREGREDSYYLDPRTLTAVERDELRWALLQTRELQKTVQTKFTLR